MASLLDQIFNRAPVPLGARRRPFFGTTDPRAGTSTALSAMGAQSTIFAIVDRIAQDLGAVEWNLYRQDRRRNKPTVEDRTPVDRHPALSVWNNPNPFHTRAEFVEATAQHFDLVGEMPWVVGRSDRAPNGPPIELWTVRPDRLRPVPHPTEFITGWLYGESEYDSIPLRTDQVLFTKRPHPTNPYRGIGPVGTLLMDLEGEKAASQFNTLFFRNGAEPGGLVIIDNPLNDDEFATLVERWQQQHRGVANAHRVGVMDNAQGARYESSKVSARDMQFEQLRRFSKDQFRTAFGFPKPLLGDVEDVNRANAEAADHVFAKHLLLPRLNRIRGTLNQDFLPMFGPLGEGYEFDYVSPVEPEPAEVRLELRNKADVAATLINDIHADPAQVFEFLGLPAFKIDKPEPPPALDPFTGNGNGTDDVSALLGILNETTSKS